MVIVVSILNEDKLAPPPFSYLGILFIYGGPLHVSVTCHACFFIVQYKVNTEQFFCVKERPFSITVTFVLFATGHNYFYCPMQCQQRAMFLTLQCSNGKAVVR